MLLMIQRREPCNRSESLQAQRHRRIHEHAEDAEQKARDYAHKHPLALRRLKNTPKKKTTKIGGAR
jgi:hypothetical protein